MEAVVEGVEVEPITHPPPPFFVAFLKKFRPKLKNCSRLESTSNKNSHFVPSVKFFIYQNHGHPDRYSYNSSIQIKETTDEKHGLAQGKN